jgi:glutamine synthetase
VAKLMEFLFNSTNLTDVGCTMRLLRREALAELEGEPATKDFFGEEFLKAYTVMRRHELSRFADWVTDWEREEYLELY